MELVATTLQGLEDLLAGELHQLGAIHVTKKKRAVSFEGDLALLYAANIHLRTALRILKPVSSFQATDPEQLYRQALEIPWEDHILPEQTFAIDFAVHSPYFTHTQYAALKLKDAIADRFRNRLGRRPSVQVQNPDIPIHLHIDRDEVHISLNSSGESLHKRGYRNTQHPAPLNEILAAGIVKFSGWDKKTPFFDPMCGSGTLVVEAGLWAYGIPPGIIRKKFAFQNWSDYHAPLYRQMMLDAQAGIQWDHPVYISGSDIDAASVLAARNHVELALLDEHLKISRKDFFESPAPKGPGTLILNPPYGERLKKEDLIGFYKRVGDVCKQQYAGWQVWIFTGNMEAAKFIGLKPARKIALFNGPLECRLLGFNMYEGSKKP